jgi:uncharacterized protein
VDSTFLAAAAYNALADKAIAITACSETLPQNEVEDAVVLADFRPGMKTVKEMAGVSSPLLEAGLTKQDIRRLSKEWGLPTYNKPSAACLSSRIAYGLPVTAERLKQVETAETLLKKNFSSQIRVRHHGNLARIELQPEQFASLANPAITNEIVSEIKKWDLRMLRWIFRVIRWGV